jgi:hypothetical protein
MNNRILSLYNLPKKADVVKISESGYLVEYYIDDRIIHKSGPYYNIDQAKDIAEDFIFETTQHTTKPTLLNE